MAPSTVVAILDGAIPSICVILSEAKDLMSAILGILDILDSDIPSKADIILGTMTVILSRAKDLTQQEGLDERRFSE